MSPENVAQDEVAGCLSGIVHRHRHSLRLCCVVRYTNMAMCEMGEMDIECS